MIIYSDETTRGIHLQKTVFTGSEREKEIHLLLSLPPDIDGNNLHTAATFVDICREQADKEHAAIVFQRFFISDAGMRTSIDTALQGLPPHAVSVVVQPPADGSTMALWAYLVSDATVTATGDGLIIADSIRGRQVWATGLTADEGGTQEQTEKIFAHYCSLLAQHGMTLEASCRRTWLFVDDIDHQYSAMVVGRNNAFDGNGLTVDSHFIASTGIAGGNTSGANVMMDAVAYKDLPEGSTRYLYASERMNRTADYGVRFERGTALTFGGTTQVFVSGTASINNRGEIVYRGDVLRQTERMMGNIETLLAESGCTARDIQQAIVYLRNMTDCARVEQWLADRYPALPRLILHAPVCRPDWLVEVECMARADKP